VVPILSGDRRDLGMRTYSNYLNDVKNKFCYYLRHDNDSNQDRRYSMLFVFFWYAHLLRLSQSYSTAFEVLVDLGYASEKARHLVGWHPADYKPLKAAGNSWGIRWWNIIADKGLMPVAIMAVQGHSGEGPGAQEIFEFPEGAGSS
jgi:hypothetical protein